MKKCDYCKETPINPPYIKWRAGRVMDVCGHCFNKLVEDLTKVKYEAEPNGN